MGGFTGTLNESDHLDDENSYSQNQGSEKTVPPTGLFKRPRVDQGVVNEPGSNNPHSNASQGSQHSSQPTPTEAAVSSLSPDALARAIAELPDYEETLSELVDDQPEKMPIPSPR